MVFLGVVLTDGRGEWLGREDHGGEIAGNECADRSGGPRFFINPMEEMRWQAQRTLGSGHRTSCILCRQTDLHYIFQLQFVDRFLAAMKNSQNRSVAPELQTIHLNGGRCPQTGRSMGLAHHRGCWTWLATRRALALPQENPGN